LDNSKRTKLEMKQVKKNLAFLLVMLCAASLLIGFPQRASSQAVNLKVLNYSYYTSSQTGNFIAVGELQNTGTNTLGSAIITGTVYTKDNQSQASNVYSQVFANKLLPNQKAPFYMEFSAESSISGNLTWISLGIDHVEFHLYETTSDVAPYSGLQIVANTSYVDQDGNYTIQGLVNNGGIGYPENVWAIAAFYDSSGTIVAVGFSNYVSPHFLPPNSTALFTLIPYDPTPQMATEITNYSLQILADGSTTQPQPSFSSSPSPAPSSSPTTSNTPSPSTPATASPNPESEQSVPLSLVYAIIAAFIIAIVIIVLSFAIKKKPKTKTE